MRGLLTPVPDIKSIFPVLLPVAIWALLFVGIGAAGTSGIWNPTGPVSFFNSLRGLAPFAVAGSTAAFVVYRVLRGYMPSGNIFGPLGLAALYGLIGLIAAFNSPDGSVALWWAGLYLSVPIVLWGVVWSSDPLEQVRPLVNATWLAVILAAGVMLALAVFKLDFIDGILDPHQFLECRQTYWYDLTSGSVRGTGVGRYAAITGLIAISGMWRTRWRPMWTVLLVISVTLLLYTGARGSFVGFGAGASLIMLIYLAAAGRRTLATGLVVIAVLAGIAWGTGTLNTFLQFCILRNADFFHHGIEFIPESRTPLEIQTGTDVPVAGPASGEQSPDTDGTGTLASDPDKQEGPDAAVLAAKAEAELIANQFFSFSGRQTVWSDGWELFKDSPVIGYGFHADRLLLGTHMHNSLLHAMLQTGLLGAIPLVLAMILAWALMIRIVLKIGSLAAADKHLVIQCAGILAFLTIRSFPESTGAFFGVDWLILAVLMFYVQAINLRQPALGDQAD